MGAGSPDGDVCNDSRSPEEATPSALNTKDEQTRRESPVSRRRFYVAPLLVADNASQTGLSPTRGSEINARNRRQDRSPRIQRNEMEAHLSQLAIQEARVLELKQMLHQLKNELSEAEAELARLQSLTGKAAADNTFGDIRFASTAELQAKALRPLTRSPSPRKKETVNNNEVLAFGKRVVDGIGTQFWNLVDDVKLAMAENPEEPHYLSSPRGRRSMSPQKYPKPAAKDGRLAEAPRRPTTSGESNPS